jgi:hypothetical protein
MNKKFFYTTIVAFVLINLLGFFVHGFILREDYQTVRHLFRSEEVGPQYMPFMLLGHAIMSVAFVLMYRKGKENKPYLGQGLRFGTLVSLLSAVPMYLIYYSIQPMPGVTVAKQIVFDLLSFLIVGVVVAKMEEK